MKTGLKQIFLSVMLLTATLSGFSQFTFGPKVGANISNIIDHTDYRAGFEAGLFFRLGTNFYFQPEVNYALRGSTFKGYFEDFEENFKLSTQYIDIPLLFGYKFISYENFNFRVFIGPRIGILLNNSLKEPRANDPLNTLQIGGQAGIGFDFWRFTLDVKYDLSATKYNSTINEATSTWWKQNMFSVALGFKIIKR